MKVYMKKEYAYHRWQTLVGGTIASAFGAIPLFCFMIPGAFTTDWHAQFTARMIPILLLGFGVPTLLLVAGLWVLHAWLTRRINVLEVTEAGVKYGSKFRRWEEIKWFSWHQMKSGGPTLFYQRKGFSVDHHLMVTDPLSEHEIYELFDALQRDVCPVHKNLNVG